MVIAVVAGPGIEPRAEGYEPSELPLLYPTLKSHPGRPIPGLAGTTCCALSSPATVVSHDVAGGGLHYVTHVGGDGLPTPVLSSSE